MFYIISHASFKIKNLSQEHLAEIVDISVTHLSHIETGNTKLSLPVFINIAHALNIPLSDLLTGNEKNSESGIIADITYTLKKCSKKHLLIIHDIIQATIAALEKQ